MEERKTPILDITVRVLSWLCLSTGIIAMIIAGYKVITEFHKLDKATDKKIYYIDIDGNKGEASFCNRDMSCVVDGHHILVKEWWKE